MDVCEGRPVVCTVLEKTAVDEGCVVCGVSGRLGVTEVVWDTGVPVTDMVVPVGALVAGTDVD